MKRQKTVEALRFLPSLFRYADAAKIVSSTNVFLTRALKAGYIERIVRGVYYNTFKEVPKVEEVACFLRTPSYVSCEWALHYHNVILQVPVVCTAITLSQSVGERNKAHYRGLIIEYSKIAEKLFFGFETIEGFNIATAEKALLDTLYLRSRIPFIGELELDNLNMTKLKQLSKVYPKAVQKRVDALR